MKDSKIVEITGLTEADIKGLMAGMPADWTDAEKVDAACVLASLQGRYPHLHCTGSRRRNTIPRMLERRV